MTNWKTSFLKIVTDAARTDTKSRCSSADTTNFAIRPNRQTPSSQSSIVRFGQGSRLLPPNNGLPPFPRDRLPRERNKRARIRSPVICPCHGRRENRQRRSANPVGAETSDNAAARITSGEGPAMLALAEGKRRRRFDWIALSSCLTVFFQN